MMTAAVVQFKMLHCSVLHCYASKSFAVQQRCASSCASGAGMPRQRLKMLRAHRPLESAAYTSSAFSSGLITHSGYVSPGPQGLPAVFAQP